MSEERRFFCAHESFAVCSQIQDYRSSTDSQSVGKLNFAEDETAVFLHIFTPQGAKVCSHGRELHCIFLTPFSADQPALLPRIRRADLEQGAVFGDGAAGDFVAAFGEEVGDVLVGEASGAGGTAFEDERNLTAHGIA